MKQADLIEAVTKHRGPIYVGVLVKNDVIYVQCVKSDLLQRLQTVGDGELEFTVRGSDSGFIDNAS